MSKYTLQDIHKWVAEHSHSELVETINATIAREAELRAENERLDRQTQTLAGMLHAAVELKMELDNRIAELTDEFRKANIGYVYELNRAEAFKTRITELESARAQGVQELTDDQIYSAAYRSGWDVRYEDDEGNETETPHIWDVDGNDIFPSLCKVVREALKAAAPVAENAAKEAK